MEKPMSDVGYRIAGITVPGVCKAMGVEPTKDMMWSVGLVIVNKFKQTYGALPPKDLRQKTYTEGVHCFAIYPEHMREVIESAIRTYGGEKARQGDLFT
jgi:hypothetical protein